MARPYRVGERVQIACARALGVAVPGPPPWWRFGCGPWLPAIVERVRPDGWVVVRLTGAVRGTPAIDQYVAPPDAVRRIRRRSRR